MERIEKDLYIIVTLILFFVERDFIIDTAFKIVEVIFSFLN